MTEKECPIKLPIKKHRPHKHRFYQLYDVDGERFYPTTEAEADFICLACNSYFGQRKALEFAETPSATFSTDQLVFANRTILAIHDKAKAALKGDTNDNH